MYSVRRQERYFCTGGPWQGLEEDFQSPGNELFLDPGGDYEGVFMKIH